MLRLYSQWLTTLFCTGGTIHSPLDRNLLFCMSRYNCTAPDILYNTPVDVLICNNVFNRITGMQLQEVDLLRECIMLRNE